MSVGLSCGHLVVGICRRCELESEVAKLGKALTLETRLSLSLQKQLDEARAEVEKLRTERAHYRHLANLIFQAEEGEELRHVAERQREACAVRARDWMYSALIWQGADEAVRVTPLVTEGEP